VVAPFNASSSSGGNASLPEIYVAGHSMGSAVGKMVAYAAQNYLNEQLGADKVGDGGGDGGGVRVGIGIGIGGLPGARRAVHQLPAGGRYPPAPDMSALTTGIPTQTFPALPPQ